MFLYFIKIFVISLAVISSLYGNNTVYDKEVDMKIENYNLTSNNNKNISMERIKKTTKFSHEKKNLLNSIDAKIKQLNIIKKCIISSSSQGEMDLCQDLK